jgi:hypothetical protein
MAYKEEDLEFDNESAIETIDSMALGWLALSDDEKMVKIVGFAKDVAFAGEWLNNQKLH